MLLFICVLNVFISERVGPNDACVRNLEATAELEVEREERCEAGTLYNEYVPVVAGSVPVQ